MGDRQRTTVTASGAAPVGGPSVARYVTVVYPQPLPRRALGTRPLIVGRAPGPGHLGFDDERASRQHCEILVVRGAVETCRIRDLNSKNGTRVDACSVTQEYLRGDAVIRVGDTLLVYSEVQRSRGGGVAEPGAGAVARLHAERLADLAAPSGLPLLLTGPTGAGKERLAARVHEKSKRGGRLVVVNCGTLDRALIGSELFGHVRGAFSGADSDRAGLFVAANRGTIFLDEIAELSLDLQTALLRVLQDARVRPVGADRETAVDVRVIAATHQDLRALVDSGRFRGDLYARLAGMTLSAPALRERREDLLPLLAEVSPRPLLPTPDAAELLLAHDWPYNVRELQHAAAQIALFAALDGAFGPDALPPEIRPSRAVATPPDVVERGWLELRLREHRGNVSSLARAAAQSRQQIYRRITALGLDPDDYRDG